MVNQPQAGVLVRGPGTSTSDSIPAALSDGELVIPADDVRRFGAAHIMALVKRAGDGLPEPSLAGGVQHAAGGGMVTDPYGQPTSDVTRVGNSYSGGNIGGNITVNGAAPGGTVSTYGAPAATPAPSPSTIAPPAAPAVAAPAPAAISQAQPLGGLGIIANNPTQQVRSLFAPPAAPTQSPGAALPANPSSSAVAMASQPGLGGPGVIANTPGQQVRSAFAPPSVPRPALPLASPSSASGIAMPLSARAARPGAYPEQVPGYAQGGLVVREDLVRPLSAYAAAPESAAMMGRRPPIDMGMAQEVPRVTLPTGSAIGGAASDSLAARAGMPQPDAASELIGRRGPINMGAAEVVQPTRLPAVATPSTAPGGAGFPVARTVGAAGAALGVALEGKQIYDVATNPSATGVDVAAQAAQGVGRLSAAGAGAAGGAAAGSALGPVGSVAGGLIGGGLGYFAADRAIEGGRAALGSDPRAPVDRLAVPAAAAAPDPQGGGGAVFGVYPRPSSQFSTNLNDAALQRGVVATGPRSFAPATPVGAGDTAVAPAARLNNLTDPRSLEYQGNFNPPAAPPPPSAGDAATAAAAAQDPGLGSLYSRGNVTDLGGWSAPAADRVAQLNRDAEAQRSLSARAIESAQQGVGGPSPGLGIIGPVDYANRNADFNDSAQLRTVLARGASPGRNGAQVFQQQVQGAALPLAQRAQMRETQAQQAGALAQEQVKEQGLAARARVADARQQESNTLDRARLGLEEKRVGIEAGKALLTANKDTLQQAKDTQDIFSITEQARGLLGQSTNSMLGNAWDKTVGAVGISTSGAEAAARLKALQGSLIAKMPKMSGPQSDKDVQLYREMAGQIGDPTIPREQRMAALNTIQELNAKYLPAPTDAAGFAGLPSGATYRAPDGTIRRKP